MRAFPPRTRRARIAVVAVPVSLFALLVPIALATITTASAQTTTVEPATTTTPPPTTAAPTTTPPTTAAPTTTIAPTSTSTSSSTSTTSTTVPVAKTDNDSSTPWGWIIAILAVIAVIALVAAALIRRSQKKSGVAQWLLLARPARDDAGIARDMLNNAERGAPVEDSVKQQSEAAALELDRASGAAPDDTRRDATAATAASLRGLQFALESEALLRSGASPPSADQLAQADVTHRTRARELDQALARLDELVPPEEPPQPPPQ